jgi:glycosyltransferase involved in cell wall biosynthesis
LANLALAPRPDIAQRGTADLDLRVARPSRPDSEFVLYSPYQLVPGGGERMLFELASVLSELVGTQNVTFASRYRYSSIRVRQIEGTFGFDNVIGAQLPLEEIWPENVRLAVVIGNSVVPPSEAFGKRSVYHIQFPFWIPDQEVEEYGWMLADYDEIWVYSEFVRRNVNGLVRHYQLDAPPIRLIPPHASWPGATPGLPWPERRTVLSVGRFFKGGHNKRQDVVIDAFRRIQESGVTGLHLALAGAIHPSPEGRAWLHELQDMAHGLDCTFYPNVGRSELAALYGRSAVLIHAAGFGVDADEFPERLEHFGITPIEAASFGCIPVVYGQGGPRDVVRALGSDTIFGTIDECAQQVIRLLRDPDGASRLSAQVLRSSHAFSAQAYAEGVSASLRDLGVL